MQREKPEWVPYWAWRLGDAFAPDPVNQVLYKRIIDTPTFYVNGWSLVHMATGYAFKQWGFDWQTAFWIHMGWEAFQAYIGMTPQNKIGVVDTVTDTAFFMSPYLFS